MTKRIPAAAIAILALSMGLRADEKAPTKSPLPREKSVQWDVSVLEDSAFLKLIKREVKSTQAIWLMENKKNLPNGLHYLITAEFLDEDGVKLFAAEVGCDRFPANWKEGERNRFILILPQGDQWKNVHKVVIKGG